MSRSFGVGCFHFELEDARDDELINPKAYADRLRAHLAQYPNVEEVSIEPFRASAELGFEAARDGDDGDIAWAVGVRPWPVNWTFSFRLNIPLRLQRELLRMPFGDDRSLEAERLDVALHYADNMPVAIIEGHEEYLSRPSTAVLLVRQYLEQYAPAGTGVRFRFMGPSPFHADFYVKFGGPEGTFEVNIEELQGYDDVDYVAGSDFDAAEVIGYAHESTAKELGVYYKLMQSRNRLMREWHELSQSIDELVEQAHRRSGWLAFKYGPWWRARLDRASLELVRFKLRADEVVTDAVSALDELAKKKTLDDLRKYSDAETARLRQYAVQDFSEMLALLERRSHAATANVTVMVAALLGGIIGAVLTALFGASIK
jgi:hypothetical protein